MLVLNIRDVTTLVECKITNLTYMTTLLLVMVHVAHDIYRIYAINNIHAPYSL